MLWLDEHTLRRRLRQGPHPDEQPGGLGLLAVDVDCQGDAAAMAAAIRHAIFTQLDGEAITSEVLVDADWSIWSMTVQTPDRLRLWLEVYGFPVSGFSSLRNLCMSVGALQVEQNVEATYPEEQPSLIDPNTTI